MLEKTVVHTNRAKPRQRIPDLNSVCANLAGTDLIWVRPAGVDMFPPFEF